MDDIYLDHNATTPVDPRALRALLPFLEEGFGNPSSAHARGRAARAALEEARAQVAAALGASVDEVIFTSGGTESNNTALKGVAYALRDRGDHLITTSVEHPAIRRPAQHLASLGCRLTVLPVDAQGLVDPDDVRRAITSRTVLVSVMHANNETGAVQPIADISRVTRERGVLLHTDAAQSVGKLPANVDELGVDLLTVAGHKLNAPKGVGALYVRRGVRMEPLLHGAGHEGGRRAGTENVAFAVALGTAMALAAADLERYGREVSALRDLLEERLRGAFGEGLVLNGPRERRLPNTLNVCVPACTGEELLRAAEGVLASTGSACHEGEVALSPVLAAMGVPVELGRGAVRFSLGRTTTRDDVEGAAQRIIEASRRLGAL